MGSEARKAGAAKPWYADGLRFECQPDCGACCTDHGDYAYVYLEGDDVESLAALLELDVEEFRRRFVDQDEGFDVLRMDQPDCPFLDGARCTVYAARPTQCRTFPFWQENVRTPKSWKRLCEFCPGVGRGERHSLRVIQQHLDARD